MFRTRFLILMGGLAAYALFFFIYFRLQDSGTEADFLQAREGYSMGKIPLVSAETGNPMAAAVATPPAMEAGTNTVPLNITLPSANIPATPTPQPESGPLMQSLPAPDSSISVPPMTTPTLPNSGPLLFPNGTSTNSMVEPHLPAFTGKSLAVRSLILALPGLTGPATPTQAAPMTNEVVGTNLPPLNSALSDTVTNAPGGIPLRPVVVQSSAIILCYHQFTAPGTPSKNVYKMQADHFEEEMKYLHDSGYHVVPLSDVVKFVKGEIGLPPRAVAITIDDGYKSAVVYAAPILKKYQYPWTFFCYPQFITTAESIGAASWKDLLQLQADGVDIESHSMTHPLLTRRQNKSDDQYDAWLTTETAGAKAELEQKMGKPIPYFAYPYGAYNKQVEAKAVAAGYEAIFTVADNPIHITSSLKSMGRYVITTPEEKNFTAYLRQGALTASEQTPAPGATISEKRPIISAVLDYAGNLDPKSIEAEVRDFGRVPCDYDAKTYTVRLYLQRDLVNSTVIVSIRARDAETHQIMVSNWHFNYEPAARETGTNQLAVPALPPGSNAMIQPALPATPAVPVPVAAPTPKK